MCRFFFSQLAGRVLAVVYVLLMGFAVYRLMRRFAGFRMGDEAEFAGSELAIHKIYAYPEDCAR